MKNLIETLISLSIPSSGRKYHSPWEASLGSKAYKELKLLCGALINNKPHVFYSYRNDCVSGEIFQVSATDYSLNQNKSSRPGIAFKTLPYPLGEQLCCVRSWQLLTASQSCCMECILNSCLAFVTCRFKWWDWVRLTAVNGNWIGKTWLFGAVKNWKKQYFALTLSTVKCCDCSIL